MAIIVKPKEQTVLTGGILSGGEAPAISGAQLANLQAETAETMAKLHHKYFKEADQSIKLSLYSNNLSAATTELNKRVQDRLNQKVDADGRPSFKTLSSDVGKIGQEVLQKYSGNIHDSDVRSAFAHSLSKHITNRQLLAMDTARKQHLDYATASLNSSVQNLSEQALADDPNNIQSYVTDINNITDTAAQSGIITEVQAGKIKDVTSRKIRVGQLQQMIDADPKGVLARLEKQDAPTLGINFSDHQHLVKYAKAAINDRRITDARIKRQHDNQIKTAQKLTYNQLELGIVKGVAGKAEILKAAGLSDTTQGSISELQKTQLLKKLYTHNNRTESLQARLDKISDAVQHHQLLVNAKPSDIAIHYDNQLKILSDDGKKPLDMIAKAQLASEYKTQVKPFQKELSFNIIHGKPDDASKALEAYQYMQDRNPVGLDGLDSQTAAVANSALNTITTTGVSDIDALRVARERVLSIDHDKRIALSHQFDKLKQFKPDHVRNTINDILDTDSFLGIGGEHVSDDDIYRFKRLLKESYIETGDLSDAEKNFKQKIKGKYSETEINSEGDVDKPVTYMFLPPESVFPNIEPSDLRKNLIQQVTPYLNGVNPKKIEIRSDELTRRYYKTNLSYGVVYTDDTGEEHPLVDKHDIPVRWAPRPNELDKTAGFIETAKQAEKDIEKQSTINSKIGVKTELEDILHPSKKIGK